MKLENFKDFQCNVSQLDKVRGGETVYSGCGRDAVNGGWVYEFCNEKGELSYVEAKSTPISDRPEYELPGPGEVMEFKAI